MMLGEPGVELGWSEGVTAVVSVVVVVGSSVQVQVLGEAEQDDLSEESGSNRSTGSVP